MLNYTVTHMLFSFQTHMLYDCDCPGLAAHLQLSTLSSRMGRDMIVQGWRVAYVRIVDTSYSYWYGL